MKGVVLTDPSIIKLQANRASKICGKQMSSFEREYKMVTAAGVMRSSLMKNVIINPVSSLAIMS